MKLDDIITQRIGSDLLEVTTELSTTIILIYITVAAAMIDRLIIVHLGNSCRLHFLRSFLRSKVHIVLSHHTQGKYAHKDC